MLIIGDDILPADLLRDADKNSIGNGSYYLRIHSVVPAGDAAGTYNVSQPMTSHTIEPGGLAWIISQEVFCIKDPTVTALVTLRSTFTKKGLLALDVGLVDFGYEGPIGSVVINFSKNRIRLDAGEEFFRVIFFRHKPIPEEYRRKGAVYSHTGYLNARAKDIVSDYPAKFLQADEVEARIEAKLTSPETMEKLKSHVAESLATYIIKKYIWRILAAALLAGCLIAAIVYVIVRNYGLPLTAEEIQGLAIRAIEARLGIESAK